MLIFDHDKSQKLDEQIVKALSTLMKDQTTIKQKEEKLELLIEERKILYNLFMEVNEERQVYTSLL